MPQNPWDVPITPLGGQPAAPATGAKTPKVDPGLIEALKQAFSQLGSQQQLPPLQGVQGGGQMPSVLDPLQGAARLQQRNQAFAKGTGNPY